MRKVVKKEKKVAREEKKTCEKRKYTPIFPCARFFLALFRCRCRSHLVSSLIGYTVYPVRTQRTQFRFATFFFAGISCRGAPTQPISYDKNAKKVNNTIYFHYFFLSRESRQYFTFFLAASTSPLNVDKNPNRSNCHSPYSRLSWDEATHKRYLSFSAVKRNGEKREHGCGRKVTTNVTFEFYRAARTIATDKQKWNERNCFVCVFIMRCKLLL